MKIYTMTATFGKLSHETLTLKPGLNLIEAPNEWGKSTWCAFLEAMLYGIDTGSRSRKDHLADKEHYAPWSGEPMSGRMELEWNGRSITIERRSKGRGIFGEFHAYETDSGIEIRELNGTNCGQMLLGVEKSVFERAGFLRQSDLPVTQDENLRNRLNALVTTGDDSGTAENLEKKLKALKNQCRYHNTGLLPEVQQQCGTIRAQMDVQNELMQEKQELDQQIAATEKFRKSLENHRICLQNEEKKQLQEQYQQLLQKKTAVEATVQSLLKECAVLPERQQLAEKLEQVRSRMRTRHTMIPPAVFGGMTAQQALQKAQKDEKTCRDLLKPGKAPAPYLWIFGGILLAVGTGLLIVSQGLWALLGMILGAGLIFAGFLQKSSWKSAENNRKLQAQILMSRYEPWDISQWTEQARIYGQQEFSGGAESDGREEQTILTQLRKYDLAEDAQNELQRINSLLSAVRGTGEPEQHAPDTLTFSAEETNRKLAETAERQKQLQQQLGRCNGKLGMLPDPEQLRKQLENAQARMSKLELYEQALYLALEIHEQTAARLQSRFAPRISGRARELMARMTENRYDRLSLSEDLSLQSGAQGENVLHSALWRSGGTSDQLYFALRMAVADVLTPEAPLILDDVFVRFDDRRLKEALKLLQEVSADRQILLFTCQSREKTILKDL